MILAERFGQVLGGISFINDNSLHSSLTSDVNINIELWISILSIIKHIAELIVYNFLSVTVFFLRALIIIGLAIW